VELLSERALWHVSSLVIWLGLQNQSLDVHPSHVFLSVARLLRILCLLELHEQHTDEKVQEEERNEENNDDKHGQMYAHRLVF
jgi:hypothetical protein